MRAFFLKICFGVDDNKKINEIQDGTRWRRKNKYERSVSEDTRACVFFDILNLDNTRDSYKGQWAEG